MKVHNTLSDIAHLCPYAGGKAVFIARAIFALIQPQATYNDTDLCLQTGLLYRQSSTNMPKSLSPEMDIYPNPVNHTLTVRWDVSENEEGELNLIDNLGRILVHKKVWLKDKQSSIWVADLPEGFYHVELRTSCTHLVRPVIITY